MAPDADYTRKQGAVALAWASPTLRRRAAEYPFKAPLVRFETPCFHPNVDHHGNICLDILKEKWSAAYSVRTVLLSLQARAARRHRLEPVSGRASVLSRGAAACAVLRRAPSPWPAGS